MSDGATIQLRKMWSFCLQNLPYYLNPPFLFIYFFSASYNLIYEDYLPTVHPVNKFCHKLN